MQPPIDHAQIAAVVLAGGRATRMGGVDKGLQLFLGQPLVQHAVTRLQMQHGGAPGVIAVNANRNLPAYACMGLPAWSDATDSFDGPLAGVLAALNHLDAMPTRAPGFRYLLTVPCDSPFFPLDLLQRLAHGIAHTDAQIAVVLASQGMEGQAKALRLQPVFALLACDLRDSLQAFLARGERKIDAWFGQHRVAQVAFDHRTDNPNAFANANSLAELRTLEQQ